MAELSRALKDKGPFCCMSELSLSAEKVSGVPDSRVGYNPWPRGLKSSSQLATDQGLVSETGRQYVFLCTESAFMKVLNSFHFNVSLDF